MPSPIFRFRRQLKMFYYNLAFFTPSNFALDSAGFPSSLCAMQIYLFIYLFMTAKFRWQHGWPHTAVATGTGVNISACFTTIVSMYTCCRYTQVD